MKNYTITVNGNVYDVTVEENGTANEQAIQQAVEAERTRIQEIEAISASIPQDMVAKAKFEEGNRGDL